MLITKDPVRCGFYSEICAAAFMIAAMGAIFHNILLVVIAALMVMICCADSMWR